MGDLMCNDGYEIFDGNMSKESMFKTIDDIVIQQRIYDRCDTIYGLEQNIRWYDEVCVSEKEARKFLESHNKGYYGHPDCLGVRFKGFDKKAKGYSEIEDLKNKIISLKTRCSRIKEKLMNEVAPTKKYEDVQLKFEKLGKDYINAYYPSPSTLFKTKTITCKHCGKKYNVSDLPANLDMLCCINCGTSLISKEVKSKLDNTIVKYNRVLQEFNIEKQKHYERVNRYANNDLEVKTLIKDIVKYENLYEKKLEAFKSKNSCLKWIVYYEFYIYG